MSTGCAGSGISQVEEGQGQLPYVLPGATLHELKQSEMVGTCAGLGDSQAKPSCESGLAAASAMTVATSKVIWRLGAH